jgi:hypothetical protein
MFRPPRLFSYALQLIAAEPTGVPRDAAHARALRAGVAAELQPVAEAALRVRFPHHAAVGAEVDAEKARRAVAEPTELAAEQVDAVRRAQQRRPGDPQDRAAREARARLELAAGAHQREVVEVDQPSV